MTLSINSWRYDWANRARMAWYEWTHHGADRTEVGTKKHGPHFDERRDPIPELREELWDAVNYLHAIESQRLEMVRALRLAYNTLEGTEEYRKMAKAQILELLDRERLG